MSQVVHVREVTIEQHHGGQQKSFYQFLKDAIISKLKKNIDRQLLVSTLYATGVLLDYLFVYIAMIIEDQKCIKLNKAFGFSALGFRTFLEIINVIIFYSWFDFQRIKHATANYIVKIFLGNVSAKNREEVRDFLMLHQFINIISVSIVYQVMLVIAITIKGKKGLIFIALNYLLWLHIPRLFVVITILLKRPRTTAIRLCTKLARLFFFLYVYTSQIFAALWYLPSIYKETQCWQHAYKNITGQHYNVFDCHAMSSEQNKTVHNYCYSNATTYDFGIYASVHNSGVLGKRSSTMQILYFSRWALQSLSSFGQGLEAGANFTQNIFIILMIVYGVFMFFFLIGEVQSDRDRYRKMTPKLRATDDWMDKKGISHDLKSRIKKHKRNKLRETRVENLGTMLSDLPDNIREELTCEICFENLKKVEEFGRWSDESLKKLCKCLKPVLYLDGTRVIQEREPITQVIFVVKGKLWTYKNSGSSSPSNDCSNCGFRHLKEGDIYGHELVNRLAANPYTSDLPTSTVTVEAVENVDAFVLRFYDLRNIFIDIHVHVNPV